MVFLRLQLVVFLLACSQERRAQIAPPAPAKAAVAKAAPRQLVTISLDVEPLHLNALDDCDEWCFRIALGAIFEPLGELNQEGRLVPSGLTTRIEESADRLSYEFELRSGAEWHDGSPLTTMDVAATYERILHPRGGLDLLHHALRDLHGVSMLDPRHGQIELDRPNSFFPSLLAEIPILPRAQVEWAKPTPAPDLSRQPFARRPIGSGPYKLVSWDRGKRLLLKRNPKYTGKPAQLEEIEFLVERDGARALATLRRGEIDILPRVLPAHWPDQVLTPSVRAAYREVQLYPMRVSLVVPNLRRKPLQDPRMRQALARLLDRQRMLGEARAGLGQLSLAAFAPVDLPAYDPQQATAVLQQLGEHEQKFELLHVTHAPTVEAEMEILKAAFREAGLTLVGVPVEPADFSARLRQGAFTLALVSYATRRQQDWSELLATGGKQNVMGFSDDTMDRLLEQLRREPEDATRQGLWQSWASRFRETMPVFPLYATQEVMVVRKDLAGVVPKGDWLDLSQLGGESHAQ